MLEAATGQRFFARKRPPLDRLCGEQNWRCCYCGARMGEGRDPKRQPTYEHVIPRIEGGPDTYENLVAACAGCNNGRDQGISEETILAVSIWEGWI